MIRLPLAFGLALALSVPGPASAQTPAEIVDRMVDTFERGAVSVQNYTVVQDVMGFRSELYYEREVQDGRPVFALKQSNTAGFAADLDDDLGVADLYALAPELAEHARYGGTEQVDGTEAHVLLIDDLQVLDLVPAQPSEDAEFRPRTGRILIDGALWVPRRMEFAGDLDTGDRVVEVTSVIDLLDYRSEQGLLLPHRTLVRMEGLGAAIDPDMRAELDQMRRQLEELPAAQRAMVEEMFRGQIEQMEALLSGGDDAAMTVEVAVVEVRVNQGPPGQ